MSINLHEDLARQEGDKPASERAFGKVFAGVFAAVGLWPLVHGGAIRWWALGVAGVFLALAFLAPALLKPANRVWAALGRMLHKIVSPLVMGVVFVVAVVPTALALRLFGKDPLRLKFDARATSYWQPRTPPGPAADSFKNQF